MLMKVFPYRLLSFAVALAIGVGFVFLLPQSKQPWQDEPRFGGINPTERFFTLAEGKTKLGREVRYVKPTAFRNTGRVVMLDMVSTDRFFAVVYWDATPETGKPASGITAKTATSSMLAIKWAAIVPRVKNKYANDPGKLAAWISASHVEKDPKKKQPPTL